jgi:hypothetical protein
MILISVRPPANPQFCRLPRMALILNKPHLGHMRRALIQSRCRAIAVAVIMVAAILMVDIHIALGRVIGRDRADIQRRKQALRPIRHLTDSDGNTREKGGHT